MEDHDWLMTGANERIHGNVRTKSSHSFRLYLSWVFAPQSTSHTPFRTMSLRLYVECAWQDPLIYSFSGL